MMKSSFSFILFFILALSTTFANMSFASEAVLQHFFAETKTLQADFLQKIVDERGQLIEQSGGKFYLSRPGKFRWDYFDDASNLTQQIIADGQSIYFYDPELEQVSVRDNKEALAQVPSLILVNSGKVLNEFFEVDSMSTIDGLSWASLKPKDEDASYQRLMLAFRANVLTEILLFDVLGNETRLQLSNIVENKNISSSAFVPDIPEGTDVLSN